MGLGKKAKREARAVKGKTKKDADKVKHKGRKPRMPQSTDQAPSVRLPALRSGCRGNARGRPA
jgi:hypothetical protein